MVFYFTGTGNSLYIAKQIEGDPISIPRIIHEENQTYTADSIGIVAPIYGHEVPQMVKDFLKKAQFSQTDLVSSPGGSNCCNLRSLRLCQSGHRQLYVLKERIRIF